MAANAEEEAGAAEAPPSPAGGDQTCCPDLALGGRRLSSRATSRSFEKLLEAYAGGTRLDAGAPPGPGPRYPPTETGAQGT